MLYTSEFWLTVLRHGRPDSTARTGHIGVKSAISPRVAELACAAPKREIIATQVYGAAESDAARLLVCMWLTTRQLEFPSDV